MNAFQRKGLISLRVPNGRIPFAAGTLKVKNYPLGLAAALRINKGIVSFLLVVGCYKNNIRRTVALKRDAPYGRGLILVSPFKDYFWVVAYQRFQSICLVSEEKIDIFGGYGKIQTF